MAVTVVPEGRLTWTAMLLLAMVPLPSWPKPFKPQASTWPVEVSARLCCPPPAMAVTVVPEGRLTATGMLLLVVVPLPSWPKLLSPQAQAEPETTAIDPAAWVPIGGPDMIVPDSARVAAAPSTARARGPLRAPAARGAMARVVTLSLPPLLHLIAGVDRSFCAVVPQTSPGDQISSSRSVLDLTGRRNSVSYTPLT